MFMKREVNKMTKLSYLEAIQNAQDLALNHFSNAFILGEDVGKKGGVFGTTKGCLLYTSPSPRD